MGVVGVGEVPGDAAADYAAAYDDDVGGGGHGLGLGFFCVFLRWVWGVGGREGRMG